MKKLLKKMGWIRHSGRVHYEEIMWDVTIIGMVGLFLYVAVLLGA